MNWWKSLKGNIKIQEPLSRHTTFKIGGPAKFFIQPRDARDLRSLVLYAKKYKIPVLVIGAGSNILAGDKGLNAIVLRLGTPYFKKIFFKNNSLQIGSGVMLSGLLKAAKENSLSGAEFLAGIPGTLGGALFMNAGAWGKDIASLVENITVMDYNGLIKNLARKDLKFSYRKSSLAKYIILSASLKLNKRDKGKIEQEIRDYLRQRRNAQDNSLPNAGCIFKNPAGNSAGKLIDLCGLKGKMVGGASISSRHANFILNKKDARAKDVIKLMDLAKEEVRKKLNITLEPEIKIWQ